MNIDDLGVTVTGQLLEMLPEEYGSEGDLLCGALVSHLGEILSWSERVQFYGMSRAEETEDSTIALTLDTVPRRFRDPRRETEKLPEDTLISDRQHYALLGDPGSGKTTTLKRLARAVMFGEVHEESRRWQVPFVFLLRQVPSAEPIHKLIADSLGLRYEVGKKRARRVKLGKDGKLRTVNATVPVYRFGLRPLEEIVAKLLDGIKALVFLDGLDEVPISQRADLEDSIEILARKMKKSKIIVSCRSGDYVRDFDRFEPVEICPLDFDQIETIASRWLPEKEDFLRRLRALPFYDLINKPLFLCQLIVFYRNTGYLPDQPAAVYRRMIRLSLEDWDAQRRVHRKSRYARFDPDQKLDFLAALAYHLTYQIKTKRFSTSQLIAAYAAVCSSYSLPPAESQKVAQEIESHTGVIVESGEDHFEFSHLSLQEYLCAYYLVREPFSSEVGKYLAEYPAPIAVAVSLAANPSNWFAALVLNKGDWFRLSSAAVSSLLSRLILERPQFSKSLYLGAALLRILFLFGRVAEEYVLVLLESTAVQASLVHAFSYYNVDVSRSDEERYWFSLDPKKEAGQTFKLDIGGSLPRNLFIAVASACQIPLARITINGMSLDIIEGSATRADS